MEAPELYSGFCTSQYNTDSKPNGGPGGDHFIVEDLLDFSNDDAVVNDCANGLGAIAFDSSSAGNNSTDSSNVTVVDSCNSSSFSGSDPCFPSDHNFPSIGPHLGGDLCVPYDDLSELEWLSNFVEESFSSEDLQRLQLISGEVKARRPEQSSDNRIITTTTTANNNGNDTNSTNSTNNPIFNHEMAVPAKARSKRSRAAPCHWASRLLVLSRSSTTTTTSSDAEVVVPPRQHPNCGKKTVKATVPKKRDGGEGGAAGNSDGRKCLHCATDKTPQWRTGPMGPKTLCNACGVRYKSGRLVPEYRPAASPTFVLTKHSNSHRKVLEIRRQKELLRAQHQHQFLQHHPHPHHHHHHHQSMVFDHVSNGDDYLIHQHVGPDFRQLI